MTATPPAVFLHIGPMKSGTSYLQQLMADNHERLRSDGIFFPPREHQIPAVRDILRADDPRDPSFDGSWPRLRDEILAFEGRAAVVSMEFLSFARRKRTAAIISSLQPAEVHVVLTLRDASQVLPSSWTESTRNRKTASWQEHVDAVLGKPSPQDPRWRLAMRALDIPRMLQAWRAVVPPQRLHVVVVPPPGSPHRLLWERFASVIRVDPTRYRPPPGRRNESFGYASADLMRRVNSLVQDVPPAAYRKTSRPLFHQVLDRRTGEPSVPMTERLNDFAAHWNDTMVEAVVAAGARVYGHLGEVRVALTQTVDRIEAPSAEALLAAAADAAAGLRQLVERRAGGLTDELAPVADQPHRIAADAWSGEAEPVAAAVREIAGAFRTAAALPSQPSHGEPVAQT